MHSRIFQIEEKRLGKDEYIKSHSFDYDEISSFADYVDDERVNVKDDLASLDKDIKGIFKREGRKLTLLNTNAFVDEWKQAIKDAADKLDLCDQSACFWMKDLFVGTHLHSDFRIYCEYGGIMNFAGYVRYLINNHKPGDVFYIGGIVDFHF